MFDVQQSELSDPHQIADTFATGLAEIEDLGGGCKRYVLYATRMIDGHEVSVVAARIVIPTEMVPAILLMAAKSLGMAVVRPPRFISGTLH